MPGPKYVKDFEFPSGFGFTGSAGQVTVRPHARQAPQRFAEGGPVKAPGPAPDPKAPKPPPPAPPSPKDNSLMDIMRGKTRKQREQELGLKRGGKVKRMKGGPMCKAMGGPVKASKGGGMKKVAQAEIAKHVRAPKPRGHGVK